MPWMNGLKKDITVFCSEEGHYSLILLSELIPCAPTEVYNYKLHILQCLCAM